MGEYRGDGFFSGEMRQPKRGGALRWAGLWLACGIAATLLAPSLMHGIHLATSSGPSRPGLRPSPPADRAANANTTRVTADPSGHFFVNADVDGAMVHFLVDTGSTYVVLSDADAAAAGVNRAALTFDHRMSTANGETRGAVFLLRSLRIGQMEATEVPAMLLESSPPISLLGMSFLKRLDHYEIKNGRMIFAW